MAAIDGPLLVTFSIAFPDGTPFLQLPPAELRPGQTAGWSYPKDGIQLNEAGEPQLGDAPA